MKTPDKKITRKILAFCKTPKTTKEVMEYFGFLTQVATYERLKHLRLWKFLEKVGAKKYKSTNVGLSESKMPEHFVLDSAWILAAVRDKPNRTLYDIAEIKGFKRTKTLSRLYNFIADGYIASYQCDPQARCTYSITPKGERLLSEIEGSKFRPAPRLNSVFSLGGFV